MSEKRFHGRRPSAGRRSRCNFPIRSGLERGDIHDQVAREEVAEGAELVWDGGCHRGRVNALTERFFRRWGDRNEGGLCRQGR